MIESFKCDATRRFWESCGRGKRPFASFATVAMRKLRMIHAAHELFDLRQPPGNRMEVLAGDCLGQHSIRINDQYRICFVWAKAGVQDVEIVDYH